MSAAGQPVTGLSPAARKNLLPVSTVGWRAEGKRQAADRGWAGVQWSCLATLWTRESQWDPNADNPTSSAYGIAQFMAFTWPQYGPRTAHAPTQIRYGLRYIADRYGTPCKAWNHWWSRVPLRGKDMGHWY